MYHEKHILSKINICLQCAIYRTLYARDPNGKGQESHFFFRFQILLPYEWPADVRYLSMFPATVNTV